MYPDKMLYFQGFARFHRVCRKLPNFRKSLENAGQNSFFRFVDGSSQIVVRLQHAYGDKYFQRILIAYVGNRQQSKGLLPILLKILNFRRHLLCDSLVDVKLCRDLIIVAGVGGVAGDCTLGDHI